MSEFRVVSDFEPTGDQPQAIAALAEGIRAGRRHQVLRGITGSGKTYTIAKVIEAVQKPTLVIAHNKTLAAQLCAEFVSSSRTTPSSLCQLLRRYQPEAYRRDRQFIEVRRSTTRLTVCGTRRRRR